MATRTYATEVPSKSTAGTVSEVTRTIVQFDVLINAASHYPSDAEFLITVNGQVVKRMNRYQAKRFGLINEEGY